MVKMNFLKILKRKNVAGFEEDFIQDPTERLIEEGRAGKTGRLPLKLDTSEDESRKKLRAWMNEQSDCHTNPGDAACPYFDK